jgi:hypothetical protein
VERGVEGVDAAAGSRSLAFEHLGAALSEPRALELLHLRLEVCSPMRGRPILDGEGECALIPKTSAQRQTTELADDILLLPLGERARRR